MASESVCYSIEEQFIDKLSHDGGGLYGLQLQTNTLLTNISASDMFFLRWLKLNPCNFILSILLCFGEGEV